MINQVFKLTAPKKIEVFFKEENILNDLVIVRPTYLAICAADQRYYQGKRKKEILDKKLPLTLIHEAVGEVIYDPDGIFEKSEKVILIPNTPRSEDSIIKENYRLDSLFRSSSYDGFMQNLVFINRDRIIPIKNIPLEIASLLEVMSVCVNAIENFKEKSHKRCNVIGVWGDGAIGYVTSLLLKVYFPDSKIVICGTNEEKLRYFSFSDDKKLVNNIESDFKVDHAFECVGGQGSEVAVSQIIEHINPQGSINLMGVSEEPIDINTRMLLEKGITMLGNSRSGYDDFEKSVELLQDKQIQDYMRNIILEEVEINTVDDIYAAFDRDINNNFKTIMRWNI